MRKPGKKDEPEGALRLRIEQRFLTKREGIWLLEEALF
jgi:hypothetical protein